jgi:hypothetical protein
MTGRKDSSPKKLRPFVAGLDILFALKGQKQPNYFKYLIDYSGGKSVDVYRRHRTMAVKASELPSVVLDILVVLGFKITNKTWVVLVRLRGGLNGSHFLVLDEGSDHVFVKRATSNKYQSLHDDWSLEYFRT